MGPRGRTRQQIIELLGRAAEQAQHAEAYHAAAADPGALKGRAAHQAARDAAALQLIELAGCAEAFTRNRGEPGTTLGRLDDALRPVFEMRLAHTHPESGITPPDLTPRRVGDMMEQLKGALENLDPETMRSLPRGEVQALDSIIAGLSRIETDGLPDPMALRPRDLHYAGYYHEIQFGRLAKETGLYDNWGKSSDARQVDINCSIFAADDMAHKFHAMREEPDKSTLPVSIVSADHRNRMPGRTLSELMSELRHEFQTPAERLAELESTAMARAREQYRDAVDGLAAAYADITGDPNAAAVIRDYAQRHPALDRETIETMREGLHVAADPEGNYLALPDATHDHCLALCFSLYEQGDGRLLDILDFVEAPNISFHEPEQAELSEAPEPDGPDLD